ncbi:MAG: NFACT family protein [Clostridia bacterium]|nr:NFACT family protein [Clostridia bacterium]
MAFDGAFLRIIKNEIKSKALSCRVDKVFMPSRNVIVLMLRSRDFSGKLLISADPSGSRIQFTKTEMENPAVPPMLCMLLRKKLVGAKLVSLRQDNLERIIYLDFDATNEMGDQVKLTLICELMGRRSNIILCDENERVIDAIRKTDLSDQVRVIMHGVKYSLPPKSDGVDITSLNPDEYIIHVKKQGNRELSSALLNAFDGLSPLICREVAYYVNPTSDSFADELSPTMEKRLIEKLTEVCDLINSGKGIPTVIADKDGTPKEFTFIQTHQYGPSYKNIEFESLSDALDSFYKEKDQKTAIQTQSQELLKVLTNIHSRVARKAELRKKDLKKTENREELRKYGELIKANIGVIKSGVPYCEVIDYYSENCDTVKIKLDPALSPAQNAAKYFKDYRKYCTAAGMLEELIADSMRELEYLDSVFDELSRAKTTRELNEIKNELIDAGYIRIKNNSKGPKLKALPYLKFVTPEGYTILAGRNNKQNDILTLKDSKPYDMWFHTKDIPGSHVIVKSMGDTIPDSVLNTAAIIAATHSKAGASNVAIPVDYCPVKKVKKPAGSPFGMVIYDNYNTAYVCPDKELCEKLIVQE